MKISIIIPALNEENYIGLLLDSLADQTYKDFEVIVVDGNSTDLTRDKVIQYAGLLDIKCINAMRKGIAFQRNLGVEHSKYEDIIFLDADGYAEPFFLEKIVKFLNSHKDVDVLTTWIKPISDKKIDKVLYSTYNRFYLNVMKKIKPQGGGAFVYIKKPVFKALGGFSEKIYVGEDHDLFTRAYKKGYKYYLLKEPCIHTSVRRLDKEGRLKHILSLSKGALYMHLVGPIENSNIINYVLEGGNYYDINTKWTTTKKKIKEGIEKIKDFNF
jgi:glycosyltransferase involved in cell wall biosynthesis